MVMVLRLVCASVRFEMVAWYEEKRKKNQEEKGGKPLIYYPAHNTIKMAIVMVFAHN